MKKDSNVKNSCEKKIDSSSKKSCVFARSISRRLNKYEEKEVSGGRNTKVVCYDTYIGSGLYYPDCTAE